MEHFTAVLCGRNGPPVWYISCSAGVPTGCCILQFVPVLQAVRAARALGDYSSSRNDPASRCCALKSYQAQYFMPARSCSCSHAAPCSRNAIHTCAYVLLTGIDKARVRGLVCEGHHLCAIPLVPCLSEPCGDNGRLAPAKFGAIMCLAPCTDSTSAMYASPLLRRT